jgi:hypothetical protein
MKSKLPLRIALVVLVILSVVLVALCVMLFRQYQIAARREAVSAARMHFADVVKHHSLSAADAGLIESWMTFGYVAVSFKVPASYLSSQLSIATSTPVGYPNITIGRYARSIATSTDDMTTAVRNAVSRYSASTTN